MTTKTNKKIDKLKESLYPKWSTGGAKLDVLERLIRADERRNLVDDLQKEFDLGYDKGCFETKEKAIKFGDRTKEMLKTWHLEIPTIELVCSEIDKRFEEELSSNKDEGEKE